MLNKETSYKENYYIMFGHLADDLCQGALPAVLALMYAQGVLSSYTQVAFLILATTVVNAIAQPLCGYFADKKARPYIMTLGMLMAALGLMFLGFVQNFYIMVAMVCFQGIGVALFHPAAGKLANIFAGNKMGKGMSIFSVGGNIGYALGPVYITMWYLIFGLKATVFIVIPAAIMAYCFYKKNRLYVVYSKKQSHKAKIKSQNQEAKENYLGTTILMCLLFARSGAMFGLTTFLPLYFVHILNQNEELSNLSTSVVAFCGAIATLLGGFISDRFGFTQLVRVSSFLAIPFALFFIQANHALLAIALLIPLSILYYVGMSPIVVIGQKLLPNHVGMATGLTIGLGISFGGLISPVLGKIGDNYGLSYTMYAIAALIVISAFISLLVPVVNKRTIALQKKIS